MSEKQRFPYDVAMAVAIELRDALAPVCERIEIAGSLRRRKASVGDIELLFVPRIESRMGDDMFEATQLSVADLAISGMLEVGMIHKRPSAIGVFTWGPKNKLAVHRSGIPVDFFATTADAWFVSLVVRTGGLETNLQLTTGAQALGKSLQAYGNGVIDRAGVVTRATSEAHVFALCGVPYREPEMRR